MMTCVHDASVNRGHMTCHTWLHKQIIPVTNDINTVFCAGFQKGRVSSEKGTFSAVNGPSKGHN